MAQVNIDSERCKGCELCTAACPQDIVVMAKKETNAKGFHPAKVIDEDKCIACGFCAQMCPDLAIEVYEE